MPRSSARPRRIPHFEIRIPSPFFILHSFHFPIRHGVPLSEDRLRNFLSKLRLFQQRLSRRLFALADQLAAIRLPLLCEVEERVGVRRRSGLRGKLHSMFNVRHSMFPVSYSHFTSPFATAFLLARIASVI